MREAVKVSNDSAGAARPLPRPIAIEVDVDAICDGEDVLIGGIMEHVEQAGVHSGDSALLAAAVLACRRDPGRAARPDVARWRWR